MVPISLWTMAAALAVAQGASPVETLATDPHFHAPDEVVPAVLPYLACLYATRGLPLLNGTEGQPIVSKTAIGGDCSGVRQQAEKDALALLAKKPAAGASPERIVADTLSSMDSYVAALTARRIASAGSGLPPVSGSMVMIEDEALPAYTRYNDCLRAKTIDTPVTSANVAGKFRRAVELCREVRAAAVEEAAIALAAKGWEAPRRRKAAVNTFEKADESWSSLGQRLYRALLRSEGQGTPARKKRHLG